MGVIHGIIDVRYGRTSRRTSARRMVHESRFVVIQVLSSPLMERDLMCSHAPWLSHPTPSLDGNLVTARPQTSCRDPRQAVPVHRPRGILKGTWFRCDCCRSHRDSTFRVCCSSPPMAPRLRRRASECQQPPPAAAPEQSTKESARKNQQFYPCACAFRRFDEHSIRTLRLPSSLPMYVRVHVFALQPVFGKA